MRDIHTLVWHYTATPAGREVSVDEIRQWHRQRGFRDVGYHKVVHLDGSVSEGRPESQVGAHVGGRNTGTLGYCYVGGLPKTGGNKGRDTRTPAQKATMERLTREAIARYGLTDVCGHRDLAATQCPAFDVRREYGHLLRLADAGPPAADPARDMGELKSSRTMGGAAVAATGGAGTAISEAAEQVAPISHLSGTLTAIFAGLTLIGIGIVMYARWDDAGRPLPWGR
jgi:hypothetical protein